jgi:hypothetical protein
MSKQTASPITLEDLDLTPEEMEAFREGAIFGASPAPEVEEDATVDA